MLLPTDSRSWKNRYSLCFARTANQKCGYFRPASATYGCSLRAHSTDAGRSHRQLSGNLNRLTRQEKTKARSTKELSLRWHRFEDCTALNHSGSDYDAGRSYPASRRIAAVYNSGDCSRIFGVWVHTSERQVHAWQQSQSEGQRHSLLNLYFRMFKPR